MNAARVLVVEDEPAVGRLLCRMLGALGCTGELVGSASEAIDRLTTEPYDLLLTDYALPGMSGGELVTESKSRWPKMPVIVATGWGGQADAEGVDHVLPKPYTLDLVRQALEQVLGDS